VLERPAIDTRHLKIPPRQMQALKWLRDNEKAELVVYRVLGKIVNAQVVWPGMPMAMHPDDDKTEEYLVNRSDANGLVRRGLLESVLPADYGIHLRALYQVSIYRHNYRLSPTGWALLRARR
jgi:hypothetical protein